MAAKLSKEGDVLKLSLRGLDPVAFQDALQKAKAVAGRRWNGVEKVWEYPASEKTALTLAYSITPNLDAELSAYLRAASAKIAEELTSKLADDAVVRVPWADKLFDFQRAGVRAAVDYRRAMIGDVMGLGKTVEALSAATEHQSDVLQQLGHVFVAAPNSMLGTWAEEIDAWLQESVVVLDGTTKKKRAAQIDEFGALEHGYLVTNYEKIGRVQDVQEALKRLKFLVQIADEGHRLKNRHAAQTLAMMGLNDGPDIMRLLLTGTPIMNSPDELWAPLAWLRPDRYKERARDGRKTYWAFFHEYVEAYDGPNGVVVTGVKNPDALRFELGDVLIRRTKKVLMDAGKLPPKLPTKYVTVKMKPAQAKLYKEAERALFLAIEQAVQEDPEQGKKLLARLESGNMPAVEKMLELMIPNGAARVVRLRQITASPALLGGEDDSGKLDAVVEIIKDASPDQQFVVFVWHKGAADLIVERLTKIKVKADRITGDVPQPERTPKVAAFQAGKTRVLVNTIMAGGVGLTLTAADTAVFVEEDWVPANNEQAEDRLHRIGQQNPVSVIVIRTEDTVDVKNVAPKNELKRMIAGAVLGNDVPREEP